MLAAPRFGRRRPMIRVLLLFVALAASTAQAADGRFVVREPKVESVELRTLARELRETGTLEELARNLNALFRLPREIGIRLTECGEANAYYDLERYEILLCLELMDGMADVLKPQFETDEDFTNALAGAFIATALHEVGHALVHVLELPITGREEDAVDQLSAWLLIQAGEPDAVLGAAATYYTDFDPDVEDFSGEHSLDRQRYFNHVCWVYGAAPADNEELISVWELPEARANQCEAEYAQLDRSWKRLLREHLHESQREGGHQPLVRNGNGVLPPRSGTPKEDRVVAPRAIAVEQVEDRADELPTTANPQRFGLRDR
jgi:hypothetical protein